MIIVDYSQIALASIIVQRIDDPELIRHICLNTLRMYNKKYREEYGQMVLACDGFNSWRKQFFPEYKGNRKKNRSASELDWFYHLTGGQTHTDFFAIRPTDYSKANEGEDWDDIF